MIYKKDFRSRVMDVIKSNGGDCSVCKQYVDGYGGVSFANMRGIKASWGSDELRLYIPKEITFTIPYADIQSYGTPPGYKHIEIELTGRRLVSIRGLQ